jgi:hypothetical protein
MQYNGRSDGTYMACRGLQNAQLTSSLPGTYKLFCGAMHRDCMAVLESLY